jgi:hypothetical protein
MFAASEDEMAGAISFASLTDAIAVAMKQWSAQHRAFIVEMICFFFYDDTVVKMQQIFCKHLSMAHHRKVSCRSTIQLWVEN